MKIYQTYGKYYFDEDIVQINDYRFDFNTEKTHVRIFDKYNNKVVLRQTAINGIQKSNGSEYVDYDEFIAALPSVTAPETNNENLASINGEVLLMRDFLESLLSHFTEEHLPVQAQISGAIEDFLSSFLASKHDDYLKTVDPFSLAVDYKRIFFVSDFTSSLASGASYNICLTVGPVDIHIVMALSMEGESEFYLYEDVIFTGGTSVLIISKNRKLPLVASQTTAVVNPSITSTGNLLAKTRNGVSTNTAGNAQDTLKWIFEANRKYLFRVTNTSGQSGKTASFLAQFLE